MSTTKVPLSVAVLDYLVELVMALLPHDGLSCRLKCLLLRLRGARTGHRVKIWRGVWVDDYRHLTVGDDVSIGQGAMFICGGGITIGSRTMVAHGAKIVSSGHRIPEDTNEPMRFSGTDSDPIVIGHDVWIGAGAIVLPGVSIGEGAVVAAGAVVTCDVEPFSVVGGVPARLLRRR